MNPYTNKGNIRTFSKDVNPEELVWHQDREDRMIEVLEGEGWSIQKDNMLPRMMKPGDRDWETYYLFEYSTLLLQKL